MGADFCHVGAECSDGNNKPLWRGALVIEGRIAGRDGDDNISVIRNACRRIQICTKCLMRGHKLLSLIQMTACDGDACLWIQACNGLTVAEGLGAVTHNRNMTWRVWQQ